MRNDAINFTINTIERLPIPAKGRSYYKDIQVRGLTLTVQATGWKSFYVTKKVNGKTQRIFLGKYPDLSIENARKKAKITIGQIAGGVDPQGEQKKIKNEATLGQLFEQYMARYSKVHKKSWRYDEREVPRFLKHWFNRRLSEIKRTEILRLRDDVYKKSGLYQANRLVERIRAMYNKGIEWGWEGTNPALNIKKFKEKSRDRFVLPAEMPFLLHSIEQEDNETARDFFYLLLLTGARKTNTLMMRYEEIVWEMRYWRIPDSKNDEPVFVPLSDRAIEILKRRKSTSSSKWVFPQEEDLSKHFINPKRAWRRILERATITAWKQDEELSIWIDGLEKQLSASSYGGNLLNFLIKAAKQASVELPQTMLDIRLHDVRRTFGSYQAISGASLQIIGKSLGHKSTQATAIYARLNLASVRASVETAIDLMFQLQPS